MPVDLLSTTMRVYMHGDERLDRMDDSFDNFVV